MVKILSEQRDLPCLCALRKAKKIEGKIRADLESPRGEFIPSNGPVGC